MPQSLIQTSAAAAEEFGDAARLEAQAERCRRLAHALTDARTADTLTLLAADYESKAQSIRRAG